MHDRRDSTSLSDCLLHVHDRLLRPVPECYTGGIKISSRHTAWGCRLQASCGSNAGPWHTSESLLLVSETKLGAEISHGQLFTRNMDIIQASLAATKHTSRGVSHHASLNVVWYKPAAVPSNWHVYYDAICPKNVLFEAVVHIVLQMLSTLFLPQTHTHTCSVAKWVALSMLIWVALGSAVMNCNERSAVHLGWRDFCRAGRLFSGSSHCSKLIVHVDMAVFASHGCYKLSTDLFSEVTTMPVSLLGP